MAAVAPLVPNSWTSGKSTFVKVMHSDGKPYAVLEGFRIDDNDKAFSVRWDPNSKNFFYVNLATREKRWDLPDLKASGTLSASRTAVAQSELEPYDVRVKRFYEVYCPAKLATVPKQLEKYKGQEDALIQALVAKYGPEPSKTAVTPQPAEPTPPTENKDAQEVPPATQSSPQTSAGEPRVDSKATDVSSAGPPSDVGAATEPPSPSSSSTSHPRSRSMVISAPVIVAPSDAPSSPRSHPQQAPPVGAYSVALAEAENRERVLTGFIHDRERRLAEAQQRYEVASTALETLRKTNRDLVQEMESLRRDTDTHRHETQLALDRLREETQVARNEWHREKQRLQAAVDDAAANSNQLLQAERLRLEEETVRFIGEKAAMQQELHKAKQDLDTQMRRSADLISILDKQEREHQRLLKQIDDLNHKIEGIVKVSVAVQVDLEAPSAVFPAEVVSPATALPQLSSPPPLHSIARSISRDPHASPPGLHTEASDSTAQAIEEFDRIMATEKYRRNELQHWKLRCQQLEDELQEAQRGQRAPSVVGQVLCDCSGKLKTLRATIGSLRSGNKCLEAKVTELELRLLAQPPDDMTHIPRLCAGSESASEDDEGAKLRETVVVLRQQLAEARENAKLQKRETMELRARLSQLMSQPSRR